ncbi:ergothioneine biosynthesis protein EgtC [Actinoalloteichus sp. AHMU CJ021]|uniref:Gamma-glutamyl-hercynylcysteine sulfoxide hydrolase n=1 Tax=Actinoalloteichus caeruleus DSM 43889 TaxID=1120930 RepID=A0ABT1JBS0_ACTCY|nr:ergothioneine biosynthesis protein EgtC [Actinoalloteichus caeruleus]AUS80570.1 ergothioneine biosynthesis protein EgtC [Actinoalloteichus sp. AHMU CJ021]MCP2329945.1 glutamine amidotransferase [Actinoalloteichus caeruleus DSM 43889]
MCRHLAYLGPAIPLHDVVVAAKHSLYRQSWAPRDMRGGGTVNADGFGVGWYPSVPGPPVRYRRAGAIWADPGFAELAGGLSAGAVLAAIRSATTGMAPGEAACAPFRIDRWLFSLNGRIAGWPDSVNALAATLPPATLAALPAATDTALLCALLARRLHAGERPPEAVADLVTTVLDLAPESRLNLLLIDGTSVVATTWTHSLWVRHDLGHQLTIASEPTCEEPTWQQVPDGSLIQGNLHHLRVEPLAPAGAVIS